jgi:uncharacterized protein YdeI (YjbR/CyaY-like superfamily)
MTSKRTGPDAAVPDGGVHFFESPEALRDWLAKHHETAREVWVGVHRVATGRPSVTWPQIVDEALCVGWIDGVRYRVDDTTWKIRLTPRRKRSIWSAVNIRRAGELQEAGRMHPAGRRAFEARDEARSAIYSYEREHASLEPEAEAAFRANEAAWRWWQQATPSYRRTATHWVTSAKRPETRARRLATLIEHSAQGRTIPPLTSPSRPRKVSA